MQVRNAAAADLPEIVRMLNAYVAAGFVGLLREEPFESAERERWFAQFRPTGEHQILVAEEGAELLGFCASFAYRGGGPFSQTVETSVYVNPTNPRKGTGSLLYQGLFARLSATSLHRAVVGIALPNDASAALHRKFGFTEIGIFDEYARFNGNYVSSLWMQKALS